MTVQSIMSTRLGTVEMDDKLKAVKEIFDRMKFHHLLVVDEGRLVGVVSDRDLLRALLGALSPFIGGMMEADRDVATLNRRVHRIMTRKAITLQPHAELADAAALFLAHDISCIPVVDTARRPVGILSWRDVLRSLAPPPSCDVGQVASPPMQSS